VRIGITLLKRVLIVIDIIDREPTGLSSTFTQASYKWEQYHKEEWSKLLEQHINRCVVLLPAMAGLSRSTSVWVMLLSWCLLLSPSMLMWLEETTSKEHIENFIRVNVLFKMLLSKPTTWVLPRLVVPWFFSCLVIISFLFWICKTSVCSSYFLKCLIGLWSMIFVGMEFNGEFFICSFKIIFCCWFCYS
jgi:hypothetical protein